jgi:hypothetical protein
VVAEATLKAIENNDYETIVGQAKVLKEHRALHRFFSQVA